MADEGSTQYNLHRDRARARARAAISRQKEAAAQDRLARADRDRAVLAMLATPGASLGSVAADVGLSKSMVAYIERTARTTSQNVEEARAYLEHTATPRHRAVLRMAIRRRKSAQRRLEDKLHSLTDDAAGDGLASVTRDTRMSEVFDQWIAAKQAEAQITPQSLAAYLGVLERDLRPAFA